MSDSDQQDRGDGDSDGVEELSDDVIIAQETAAHAPAPRRHVTTDHPTVVISEPPGPRRTPTVPPARRAERAEKTVVIRDRRELEKLRRAASRRPARRSRSGTVYWVLLAVLLSVGAGSLLAIVLEPEVEGGETVPAAPQPAKSGAPAAPVVDEAPEVIDLQDLPVEKKKRRGD